MAQVRVRKPCELEGLAVTQGESERTTCTGSRQAPPVRHCTVPAERSRVGTSATPWRTGDAYAHSSRLPGSSRQTRRADGLPGLPRCVEAPRDQDETAQAPPRSAAHRATGSLGRYQNQRPDYETYLFALFPIYFGFMGSRWANTFPPEAIMASTHRVPIEEHPDLMELRARHDRAAATPRAQTIEALALITGLYLAASPWIAGFNGFTTLAVTNLIAGIAYMLLLGGLGTSYERTHSMAWAAAVIGIWTCVAPWVVAGDVAHTRSITSNIITGAIATLLALAAASAARDRTDNFRRGTGPAARDRTMPGNL